jgi:hypothetical protein
MTFFISSTLFKRAHAGRSSYTIDASDKVLETNRGASASIKLVRFQVTGIAHIPLPPLRNHWFSRIFGLRHTNQSTRHGNFLLTNEGGIWFEFR